MKRLLLILALVALPSMARANCVVGATGAVGGGTCAVTGSVLIGTLTASSSASLQFYGSNWSSSYGTLRLRCRGMILSGNNNLLVQVGEGGGGGLPTWETSGNYKVTEGYVNSADGFANAFVTSTSIDLLGVWPNGGTSTTPSAIDLEIDNVSSGVLPKLTAFHVTTYRTPSNFSSVVGSSYWAPDTAAITGLMLSPSAGTITSGVCSLYGVLQ